MDLRQRVLGLLAEPGREATEPDVAALAVEAGVEVERVLGVLTWIDAMGLCVLFDEAGLTAPVLTRAGRQWLAGDHPEPLALGFLAHHVDDLAARRAVMAAATTLVGEFGDAIARGLGVGYAQQIVPPAFVPAVDDALAVQLFAALVAVVARLTAATAAACVAEELMAVALIAEATSSLEDEHDAGHLTADDLEEARSAMSGIFDLFGDDDVLMLFEMSEPADAAVSGHRPENLELGVVDQRVEAWFTAFGGALPVGHVRAVDDGPA